MKKIFSINETIKKLVDLSEMHKRIEIECIEENGTITLNIKKKLSFEAKKEKIIGQIGNAVRYLSLLDGETKIATLVEEAENNCFKVTEILSKNPDEFGSFEFVNIYDIQALAHYNYLTEKYEFEELIDNIKLCPHL